MSDPCPECETGYLTTRSSKRLGTNTIKRRRKCSCKTCHYKDIVILRPAQIISIRVVYTTEDQSQNKNNL